MKNRIILFVLFAAGLFLISIQSYAQQGIPNGGIYSSPWSQPQSPYASVPPYAPIPPMSPRGYSRLGGGLAQQRMYPPQTPVYRGATRSPDMDQAYAESVRKRCEVSTSVPFPSVQVIQPQGNDQAISRRRPMADSSSEAGSSQAVIPIGILDQEAGRSRGIEKSQGSTANLIGFGSQNQAKINGGKNPNEVGDGSSTNVPTSYRAVSMIEASYIEALGSGSKSPWKLRQYGYSLFASPISTFAPVDDVPVSSDYVLGPGDDLVLNIWGAMEGTLVLSVDRNGEVKLPSAGPVKVWGLRFSQANQIIREHLSRYYRGFKASVTMGRLRTTLVYVVGEVCQPGAFTLSSLSNVTNALFAAGGPVKLGSLRNIILKRNQQTVGTLDLYDFLLHGNKTNDLGLRSGDTIFVPPIGPTTAIIGEVKRPAIYELKEGTTVRELIEMAGGVTPRSYLKRVQVIRTKPNSAREIIDLDLTNPHGNGHSPSDTILLDGDSIKIYRNNSRIYNMVILEGAVKQSGKYELKPGMRLADLLPKERLLPEAFSDSVEVARFTEDLSTNIIEVDLKKAWNGDKTHNIFLKRMDLISVRSDFKPPSSVRLEGELVRPGIYRIKPGERLSSVLKRAGGFTEKAFLRGSVFTRKSVEMAEKRRLDDFVTFQEQLLLADTSQKGDLAFRREQLRLLASKIRLGRVIVHLDQPEQLAGSPNDVVLMDGDRLEITQKPATVLVMGSVRNPTAVLHWDDGDLEYYLYRAGGLTPDADENQIYVIRADGSAVAGFMKLRDIEAGDGIIVPPNTEKPVDKLPLISAIAGITGQLVLGLAGLLAIF